MSNVWERLNDMNVSILGSYLKNEYPQTVAVILTKLDSVVVAQILEKLPESFAMEVIMRIGRLAPVNERVLQIVERSLEETLVKSNVDMYSGSVAFLGDVFSNLGPEARERFLSATQERNEDFAEQIASAMV